MVAKKKTAGEPGEMRPAGRRDSVDALVADLQKDGWEAEPFERAIRLALDRPDQVAAFARRLLREYPDGGTFLDAALSFMPLKDWPALVKDALRAFKGTEKNHAAESVVEYASLQCPSAAHQMLDRIFDLGISANWFLGPFPWRESGTKNLAFLESRLARTCPHEVRLRAFRAMLETRHPEVLDRAVAVAPTLDLSRPGAGLDDYLALVGIERRKDGYRRLYPERPIHLGFRPTYLQGLLPEHPTWKKTGGGRRAAPHRFGGSGASKCSFCGKRLHHLLTIDPVPESLGVTGQRRLSLECCLSCLGWEQETLFFRHDALGNASPIRKSLFKFHKAPQFPTAGLVEGFVALVPLERRWTWQEWGAANSRENLHRLGGHPSWVQDANYPKCPECSQRMAFLLQLDSELPAAEGAAWLWGSGGMAYCFWCDGCRTSAFLWQCT